MNRTGNITSSDDGVPTINLTPTKIVMLVGLSLICLITIVGNFIVLLSFLLEPNLRQPFNYFIFNLAVTDFLIAVTAMTFYTLDTTLGYWPFGPIMCGFWIYFDYAMTFASVFTLVAISIDRFWSVTWVMHYRQKNTPKRTLFIIGIVWACVLVIWTPPFIGDRMKHNDLPYKCIWEPSENQEFIIIVDVIGHYIPCCLMVFCYIKVYVVMRRQSKVMMTSNYVQVHPSSTQSQLTADSHENSISTIAIQPTTSSHSGVLTAPNRNGQPNVAVSRTAQNNQRERKIFVTLTYVVASYLICWLPFYVTWDFYAWHPSLVPEWLYTFFFWMTYINSTLNPLLYGYTNKEFRTAFKKLLSCQFNRPRH